MPFQFAHAPMGVLAFADVEADFQRVVEFEDFLIVAPTQFARQCRAIWEYRVELAHILQVVSVEPAPIPLYQVARQAIEQSAAISVFRCRSPVGRSPDYL